MSSRYRLATATRVILLVCVAIAPSAAFAQFAAVESLLSRISDIGFYGEYAGFFPKSRSLTARDPNGAPKQNGLYGYGLELSFSIGALTQAGSTAPADRTPNTESASKKEPGEPTEIVVTQIVDHGVVVRVDTARKYTVKALKPPARDTVGLLEFALGYGQIGGFRAQSRAFDLRGVVREFPAVSIYFTDEHTPQFLSTYYGLRSGLISLSGLQAFDSSQTVYSATAQTFQIGAVYGKVIEVGHVNVFLEGSYTFRNFGSIEWKPVNNKVPSYLPHALGMSGWGVSIGVQAELRTPTGSAGTAGK